MKSKTTTIYQCGFCKKWYQKKHFALYHEKRCSSNPDNERVCLNGCAFLSKEKTRVFFDYPDGSESHRIVELFFCKKIDSFLYPPKIEHKGEWYETEKLNEPMKRKCEFFEHKEYDYEEI